jgi:hypothetical protein
MRTRIASPAIGSRARSSNRAHPPEHAGRPLRSGLRWFALTLVALVAFAVGRLSASREGTARITRAESGGPTDRDRAARKSASNPRVEQIQRQRVILSRPVELVEARSDEAAEQLKSYERQQARDMMDMLMRRVQLAAHTNPGDPEGAVAATNEYLAGWVDGVIRTAPDLADELATEMTATLCGDEVPPTKSLAASRLGLQMPELASSEGLDCVFTRQLREGELTEDVVLWAALDTWQRSGLPKTPALEAIEAAARDERTRRRFMPLQDVTAQRVAASQAGAARADSTPNAGAPSPEGRSSEQP